jgi:hypothetical protein
MIDSPHGRVGGPASLRARATTRLAEEDEMSRATIEVAPTQWANLKDIHEVEPLNEADYPCLSEIRDVLKKYDRQERFGVALLHKHFDMEPDEVLVEHTNVQDRILTICPVQVEAAGETIQTIWSLGDGAPETMLGCQQYCGKDVQGNHNSFHRAT